MRGITESDLNREPYGSGSPIEIGALSRVESAECNPIISSNAL